MTSILLLALLSSGVSAGESAVEAPRNVMIYYEAGRFGGWPANHGIWSWGNEILVGFSRGYYKDLGNRHHIDREKPEEHWLARSLDGGETWTLEHPTEKGFLIPQGEALHGTELPGVEIPPLKDCPGGIDFTHPDFAMTIRMTSHNAGASRIYYSYDRGHTWEGPFRLPDYGTPGLAPRTDYVVNGPSDCMLFLTAAKPNAKEGRPLCVQTQDGGATWNLLSWIGPEPKGFSIMPATARISENEILTLLRHHEGSRRWIEAYRSQDNGHTWEWLNNPVEDTGTGNPATLTRLQDGRLALTYGFRAEPYSMRAKISTDNGLTWGPDIVLRDDGAGTDIGYPRTVQRPDGKLVTVYYFHDNKTGPERYIAATIWDPGPNPTIQP